MHFKISDFDCAQTYLHILQQITAVYCIEIGAIVRKHARRAHMNPFRGKAMDQGYLLMNAALCSLIKAVTQNFTLPGHSL